MKEPRTAPCRRCGDKIVFLLNEKGKRVPCDPVGIDEADEYFDRDRHVRHFATCPNNAAKSRRMKK